MHELPHDTPAFGHEQVEPEQTAPAPTVVAQLAPALLPPPMLVQLPAAPQYPSLVVGSMQVPPQFTCPDGQVTAHAPLTQICPRGKQSVPSLTPAQLPVAPQNVRSVAGSMHVPPHETWAPGQAQVPVEQTAPVPTVLPQLAPALLPTPMLVQLPDAPQKLASMAGFTQLPPQLTCPDGHDTTHALLTQTCPARLQSVPGEPMPPLPQPVLALQ
jgi:hypothetical protein